MSVGNPPPETPATSPAQPARAGTAGKVRWRRVAILMIPSAAVAAVLDFSGGVVLYATELSGRLLGIPVRLTPGNVVTVLLKLLNSLTPLVPSR
jgi:hypothetical protein